MIASARLHARVDRSANSFGVQRAAQSAQQSAFFPKHPANGQSSDAVEYTGAVIGIVHAADAVLVKAGNDRAVLKLVTQVDDGGGRNAAIIAKAEDYRPLNGSGGSGSAERVEFFFT